jgi:hypothetical protein
MTEPARTALQLAWDRQSVWSQTAGGLKSEIQRARRLVLGLSIAGAVLAALAISIGVDTTAGAVLSIAGAACILLVPIVRSRAGTDTIGAWTTVRSVSEALKSEVYLYLTRVGDYAGAGRDDALVHALDGIEQEAADLLRHGLHVQPATREPPAVHDLDSYVAARVTGQIDGYYLPQAATLERRVGQVRTTELVLAVAGAILAAIAGATGAAGAGVWAPVATTLTGAVGAHAAAERYEFLLVEYLRTASELGRLRRRLGPARALSDEQFVRACERVISLQNAGWMAKLTKDDDE